MEARFGCRSLNFDRRSRRRGRATPECTTAPVPRMLASMPASQISSIAGSSVAPVRVVDAPLPGVASRDGNGSYNTIRAEQARSGWAFRRSRQSFQPPDDPFGREQSHQNQPEQGVVPDGPAGDDELHRGILVLAEQARELGGDCGSPSRRSHVASSVSSSMSGRGSRNSAGSSMTCRSRLVLATSLSPSNATTSSTSLVGGRAGIDR